MTAIFADVVGSTVLGEKLSPAEVKALVGECVSRMCEAVESYGGAVRSYMGDGIAAFFGLEATQEDDTERAAHAALEIRRVMADYASDVREAWGVTDFQVRVGLNRGRVAVGLVGSSEPLLTALGDAVNVAARLQAHARPGAIVVGCSVAAVVKDRFALRPIGNIAIRGRSATVDAFELEGPGIRPPTRRTTRFVGRAEELGALSVALEELQEGRGQVCFILGEGGLGKTRLVEEAKSRLTTELHWLSGYCDPMDQRLPFEPFVDAIRSWLGVDRGSSPIETRIRLLARGAGLFGEQFDDFAGHFGRLLGVELSPRLHRRLEGLPSGALVAGLATSYGEWLTRLSRERPVVLALDNFGCANQASAEFLNSILGRVEAAPVAILLTMRPDVRAPGWDIRTNAMGRLPQRCIDLRLLPLATAESEEVLRDVDQVHALAESVSDLIVQRAEGNPLYLEELYSAITNDPDSESDRVRDALPDALETLLLARIDALPRESRRLLQAAAVLGRSFLKEVLITMAPSDAFDEHLMALLRADVIREQGFAPAGFVFRHGLVREAALSTLTPVRYRQLNATAASALEAWGGFDIERDADALAGHFLAAGDLLHAIEPLERLGDRMAMVYRFDEAIRLFDRCLNALGPAGPRTEVIRLAKKESEAEAAVGNLASSIQLLELALELESHDAELGTLLIAKAEHLAELGKPSEAAEALWRVLDLPIHGDLRTKALTSLGMLALGRQDLEEAQWCVDACSEPPNRDQSSAFELASLAAGIYATKGELELAEVAALNAQAISERVGRLKDQLTARRHVAIVCMLKGEMREAFELQKQVYESCERFHLVVPRLEAGVNLITFSVLVGELEYGRRVGEELLSTDLGRGWSGIRSNLAGILIERNEMEAAEALVSDVLNGDVEADGWERTIARRMIGNCRLLSGDVDAARTYFDAARADAMQYQLPSERAFADAHLAELSNSEGHLQDALQRAEEGLHGLDELDVISRVIVESRYLSILGLSDAPVMERLEKVLGQEREMGLRLLEARTLMDIAAIQVEGSEGYFEQARRIFEECGCGRGLAELEDARRRLLHGVGVHV